MTESLYKEKKEEVKLTEVEAGEAPPVEITVAAESAPLAEQAETPRHEESADSAPNKTANVAETSEFSETPPDLGPRYDILGLVGTGGMGTVWKVHDKELGEDFAIKVLKPELVTDETALKRFQKEANLASELTHANIAAIFGPGEDGSGRPYIIMRYVDGESLADILKREGKLSEERAMDIFSQLCEALSHSHMKGIVHRDIKPSNIIISKTESGADLVQLVDFGIARCVYDEVTKTQALTKAVDVFGSPRYMSPEQLLGEEVTAKSDIYSLGIVLYEMLTGAAPFNDENPVSLILKQLNDAPDLSSIPEDLTPLIELCLRKTARARPGDASQISLLAKSTHNAFFPSSEHTGTVELIALFVQSNFIFVPIAFASVTYPVIQTFLGLAMISLACLLNLHNQLLKLPVKSMRRLEFLFLTSGLVLFPSGILIALFQTAVSQTYHDQEWGFSQLFSMSSALLVTAISMSLYKSQPLFILYERLASKLSASGKIALPNKYLIPILKPAIKSLFLAPFAISALFMASSCATLLILLPAVDYMFSMVESFVGYHLSQALYFTGASFFFLSSMRGFNTFNFMPRPKEMVVPFLALALSTTAILTITTKLTESSGIVDYLFTAVRNNGSTMSTFPVRRSYRPSHPNTRLGATAILRARNISIESVISPSAYQSIIDNNSDPLLRAAAALLIVDPNAFHNYRTFGSSPPPVSKASLESVFKYLEMPEASPEQIAGELVATAFKLTDGPSLKPFSRKEVLLAAADVAYKKRDSQSIRRAEHLLREIATGQRDENLELELSRLLNRADVIEKGLFAEPRNP